MRLRLLSLIGLLVFPTLCWAVPDTTLTIAPSASSGSTITAADENDRNGDVTTAFNAHSHTDISQVGNTLNVGDGTAGNKNICGNAADSSDRCIRWDDTNDLWTIQQASTDFHAAVTSSGTGGLTAGGVLTGNGTGSIQATNVLTNGQLLIGDGSGAPTLATLTASGGTAITNGSGAITIFSPGLSERVHRTAGSVTTSSGSFVDFTGASITITTGANPVLLGFSGVCSHSSATDSICSNFDIDGALVMGSDGLCLPQHATADENMNCNFTAMSADLSAGSHTFKFQWRVGSGATATMLCTTNTSCNFWVQEVAD